MGCNNQDCNSNMYVLTRRYGAVVVNADNSVLECFPTTAPNNLSLLSYFQSLNNLVLTPKAEQLYRLNT